MYFFLNKQDSENQQMPQLGKSASLLQFLKHSDSLTVLQHREYCLTIKHDLPNACDQSMVNRKCLLSACTELRGGGSQRSPSAVSACKADKKLQTPQNTPLFTSLPNPFCLLSGVRRQSYFDRMQGSDDWHANVHNNCPTLLQFLFITYSFQYQ